jgi:hypothetical protein
MGQGLPRVLLYAEWHELLQHVSDITFKIYDRHKQPLFKDLPDESMYRGTSPSLYKTLDLLHSCGAHVFFDAFKLETFQYISLNHYFFFKDP